MGQACCSSSENESFIEASDQLSGHGKRKISKGTDKPTIEISEIKNIHLYTSVADSRDQSEDTGQSVNNNNTLLNYENWDFSDLFKNNFIEVEASKKSFPHLSYSVTDARNQVLQKLKKLQPPAYEAKVYNLTYDLRTLIALGTTEILQGKGYCALQSKNGEYFEGIMKEFDIYHGLLVIPSGDFYFGTFKNFLPHGFIKLVCANGDQFEGFMHFGKRDGKGKIEWADGSRYVGNFKNGKKWGEGNYKYSNGDMYKGVFSDDLKNGRGTYIWSDGRRYVGEWAGDLKEGEGTFEWGNGLIYNGQWKEDLKEGPGVVDYPDGKKVQGKWVKDMLHGRAVVIGAKGETREQFWHYGSLDLIKNRKKLENSESKRSQKFSLGEELDEEADNEFNE